MLQNSSKCAVKAIMGKTSFLFINSIVPNRICRILLSISTVWLRNKKNRIVKNPVLIYLVTCLKVFNYLKGEVYFIFIYQYGKLI